MFITILYPYFKHQVVRFGVANHAYGTTHFEVADFKKPFIHAYAVAYGLGLTVALGGLVVPVHVNYLAVLLAVAASALLLLWCGVRRERLRLQLPQARPRGGGTRGAEAHQASLCTPDWPRR